MGSRVDVKIDFKVPCRDTGEPIDLQFVQSVPVGFVNLAAHDDFGWLPKFCRDAFRAVLEHELDESSFSCGSRMRDPHAGGR